MHGGRGVGAGNDLRAGTQGSSRERAVTAHVVRGRKAAVLTGAAHHYPRFGACVLVGSAPWIARVLAMLGHLAQRAWTRAPGQQVLIGELTERDRVVASVVDRTRTVPGVAAERECKARQPGAETKERTPQGPANRRSGESVERERTHGGLRSKLDANLRTQSSRA